MEAQASGRPSRGLRNRTSSFFDLAEYSLGRLEQHAKSELKGEYVMSHCETPDNSRILDDFEHHKVPHHKHKQIKTQNTFQLDPKLRFNASLVENILSKELEYLNDIDYDPEMARKESVILSDNIKSKIKNLFPRYKYVVQVTIGGKFNQGIKVASKCFWDKERDNFASHTVSNATLFAVATVYGLYYE